MSLNTKTKKTQQQKKKKKKEKMPTIFQAPNKL